jgi:hypothetical protein
MLCGRRRIHVQIARDSKGRMNGSERKKEKKLRKK